MFFFFYLLNSESGGAPFLAQEDIMHYTGQVSQLFTKKTGFKKSFAIFLIIKIKH